MNKKAQLSLVNIMYWLVTVIISVIVVSPLISSFVTDAIATNNYTTIEQLLMKAILSMYWVVVLMMLFMFANPRQELQQFG